MQPLASSAILKSAKKLMQAIMTDKYMLYIICPYHIGDILFNGGFCHALQKKKRKKSCVLILCEKYRKIGIHFIGCSDIIYISEQGMNLLKSYIVATSLYETDQYIYGHFHGDKDLMAIWDITLCFADRYRKDVFYLPLEEPFTSPIVDELSAEKQRALHDRYRLDERTIILMPHAYSVNDILDADFWVQLTVELCHCGYTVYTNVTGTELPVRGTTPIQTTFTELFYLSDKVKCFIALRSGIVDFLAFSKAKILCILNPSLWYYDLKLNYPGCNSYNYYYIGQYRKEIEDFMHQHNVKDIHDLNFSAEHVNPQSIYLNQKKLIAAILQDVASPTSENGGTSSWN